MNIEINSEAINFFKINGFKQSKDIISTSQQPLIYCGDGAYFHINQLKKIVDAFDWVEKFGGLDGFKDEYMSRIENNECVSGMNNVIELVEKCK